mgnify:CR=1 FL=1
MGLATNGSRLVGGFDNDPVEFCTLKLKELPGVDHGLIISVGGEVNTGNAAHFQRKVEMCILAGYRKILFECGSLNYLSSTGVGSFVAFLKELSRRGGKMVLTEIQPRVYEVLQLLGFTNFLTIKDSLEECVAYLEDTPIPPQVVKEEAVPEAWPKTIACPSCRQRLKAPRAAKFRCSHCKAVFQVFESGSVRLL